MKIIFAYLGFYFGLATFLLLITAGFAQEFNCHWFDLPAYGAIVIGFFVWVGSMITDAIKTRQVGTMLLCWCLWIVGPGIVMSFFGLLGPVGRLLYLFLIPPWPRE
jgi:hypothetical protein